MKYPYLFVTIAYALGVYLSSLIKLELTLIILIPTLVISILVCILTNLRAWNITILISSILIGNLACNYKLSIENSDLYKFSNEYITVHGRISELPKYSSQSGNYTYTISTKSVNFIDTTYDIKTKLNISTPEKYQYGSTISASGFLKEYSQKNNSSDFDYKIYYYSRGISFKMYSYSGYNFLLSEPTSPTSIYDGYNFLKSKVISIVDLHFSGDYNALLRAILTGDKSIFSDSFNKQLTKSGAMRFLYAPYINVLFLMWLLSGFVSLFGIPRKIKDILLILILTVFAGLNIQSPTFIKCAIVMIFYTIYTRKNGFLYVPDALPFAILVIILFNPLYLYNSGFIISVASTILIFFLKDYSLPYFSFIKNKILRNAVCIWIILTIGLLPLCAFFYYGTSIYTIIFTLVLSPIILIIMITSPLMLLLLALFSQAPILYQSTYFLLIAIKEIVKAIAALPFSFIYLPAPTLVELLFFYSILVIIKAVLDKSKDYIFVKVGISSVCFVLILISHLSVIGDINFSFVNVGQGDGAIVWIPYRETILIDGGGGPVYSNYNVGENVFAPYLASAGHTKIDIAIVTHYHKDHCEGIITALENYRVRRLILPDCDKDNEFRIKLENASMKNKVEILYLKSGDVITFKSGLQISFLSPNNDLLNDKELNNTSLVADIKYGEIDALFTGDITTQVEESLLCANILKQNYEILKVAHHGSDTSSSQKFIESVSPKYSVISVGENNTYNLPSKNVISRLSDIDSNILRTDLYGNITISANKNHIKRISYFKDGE